jgi:hypothetical protein
MTEEIDNFYKLVRKLLPSIDYEYKKGKSILLHCLVGNQCVIAFNICKKITLKMLYRIF